jgi:hypothetical protein
MYICVMYAYTCRMPVSAETVETHAYKVSNVLEKHQELVPHTKNIIVCPQALSVQGTAQ